MRIRDIIISALILVAGTVRLSAQNGINSTVEVEREYEGRIVKTVKSPLDIPVEDSLLNFKLDFDYTTFYSPYKDLYEFSPILTLGPANEGRVIYPWLYARLAAAYPWTPSADLYITPRLGNRFSLGLHVNHDSFWGKLPLVEYAGSHAVVSDRTVPGNRMKNTAGVDFGYRWKKGELHVDADYSRGLYAMNDGRSDNRFSHFSSRISVFSSNPDPNSFYYNVSLGYRHFENRLGVAEHLGDVDLAFGATVRKEHRVYLRLKGTFSNSGVWEVAPVYRWERDRWRVKAGLAFSSAYGPDVMYAGNRGLLYPDAAVSFEAARNALWLYLKVFGENEMLTRYDLFAICPWLDNSPETFLRAVPFAADLGLRGLVRDRFSYAIHVGYSKADNWLSFVSMDAYQQIAGGNTHVLRVGGNLRWKSRDFMAQADFLYRYFSDRYSALMTPAFELKAVLEYNLKHRLFIQADCCFRTAVTGASGSMYGQRPLTYWQVPASVDVGLRISYAINPGLMVFLEGDNLANSRMQCFLGYIEPGTNIGLGLCLKM